mmetsp:Transcript_38112/g.73089  ORF Transcript_38112/g.73089 Transcript_38112/m.73089 type:complete len:208 (+) Transcript_38112:202-825(+)
MIDVDVGTVHRGEEFRAAVVETHETVNGEGLLSTSSNTGAHKAVYTLDEVRKHANQHDAWIAVGGKVYDITEFISSHWGHNSGGAVSTFLAIIRNVGTDCTEEFTKIHSKHAWKKLSDFYIGELEHSPSATQSPLVPYSLPEAQSFPMPEGGLRSHRHTQKVHRVDPLPVPIRVAIRQVAATALGMLVPALAGLHLVKPSRSRMLAK